MNRDLLDGVLFDARRLAFVAVVAALVIVLDLAALGLIGIESATEAVLQFVTIAVGAYVGLAMVDVALEMEESDPAESDPEE